MKKYFHPILLSVLSGILLSYSCDINTGYKSPQQVSLTIREAKEKKVFVAEYKIRNVILYDSSYRFPINTVWEEKPWNLSLDNSGNETYKIQDSSSDYLVFSLNNNDTLFTDDNFIEGKWIMWDSRKENAIGSIRGMIEMMFLDKYKNKDSLLFNIYKQKNRAIINYDLTKIASFTLERKQ